MIMHNAKLAVKGSGGSDENKSWAGWRDTRFVLSWPQMGRPAKPKGEKQSKLVAVRLTPGDYQTLKRLVAAVERKPKLSLSAYLRERGLAS